MPILAALVLTMLSPRPIDLSGTWRVALDRTDQGIHEQWYHTKLKGSIQLPGSLQGAGMGDQVSVDTKWTGQIVDPSYFTAPQYAPYRKPGNIKVPFWLQPNTVYTGVAWYQREFTVPAELAGKAFRLELERPHWSTEVWVDDQRIGTDRSLNTPHRYLIPALAKGNHRLSIRVDNRMIVDVGYNSHSVTDHTQGNWNGIVGKIHLTPVADVRVDSLVTYPSYLTQLVKVTGSTIGGAGKQVRLAVETPNHGTRYIGTVAAADGTFKVEIPLGPDAQPWSEFSPTLYRLSARIEDEEPVTTRFGLRDLTVEGTEFRINEKPLFIRGTLECAIFPKTGHPPTDIAEWKRIIGVAKSHGLNLLRFHSWCPPAAAFDAADEMGFYFQVECGSWGAPGDDPALDKWLYEEADRILAANGNHPSFMLMPYGNEPLGKHSNEYLAKFVTHYRGKDPRRLYTSGSGWPQIAENQFHVTPDPRIQGWGEGVNSRINAKAPETVTDYRKYIQARSVPVVSHEIGQWCVYPNFDEMKKYTGYLKPKNFEIFHDFLKAKGMADQAHDFLIASGKLQTLCYKEDIESALRTPGMGGFELLDLHDFPGQGTALVGVLDPFWESKGYVTPTEYHEFAGPVVPLARLPKRVFRQAESLVADVEVANYGPSALNQISPAWRLLAADGKVALSGNLPTVSVPLGNGHGIGHLSIPLGKLAAPAKYSLEVSLPATSAVNRWDIWVYPDIALDDIMGGLQVCHDVEEAIRRCSAGEKVLLLPAKSKVINDKTVPVQLGFSSIFWNTAWTTHQAPTTLGVLVKPEHPLFANFPTEPWSNWQWWYIIHRATPMILDPLPTALRPTVQVIDDWFTARKLGLGFEAKVGAGKLFVCSVDLESIPADDPVTLQFKASLLRYLGSEAFQPSVSVTADQLRQVVGF